MRPKSDRRLAPGLAVALGLACLATPSLADGPRAEVPAREVRGVDGRLLPLVPAPGGATAVVFYSTECPISNEYSPTLNAMVESRPSPAFALVGICVDPDASAEDVAVHAREFGLKFPVALDRDGSLAARFGARVTPEAFVVDPAGKVRYHGRIDDQYAARGKRNAQPRAHELRDALAAVLEGREVAVDHTEAVGCPVPARPGPAPGPTFARDVAPILQQNCLQCHRPDQVGPFPLVTFEHARKRAADIATQVADRRMPPWKPDPAVGPGFKHSKALTEAEIATVVAWAEAGAPEGDPAAMPKPPEYRTGWTLGDPDLVLEMPEDFAVPADGGDLYRCFVLPTSLPDDKYIAAIEYRPGNRRVVHHILTYVDVSGEARKRDEKDPGAGYTCFSGPGIEVHGDLGGWAPGNEPSFLPDGVGRVLPSKSDVVMQVHYHPSGKPEVDRTRVGLYFAKRPIKQVMHWNAALNTAMKIPPGAKNYPVEAGHKGTEFFGWEVPVDVTALAVTPHMHQLGRDIAMSVTYPDGRDQDLIRIGDWDFDWQNTYYFDRPIDLPKGTVLKVRAHYDNTTKDPVKWGEATTDEMCIGFLAVVKKGQDLTRPGESDDLGEIFREQEEERREKGRKLREEARRKAEQAKSK